MGRDCSYSYRRIADSDFPLDMGLLDTGCLDSARHILAVVASACHNLVVVAFHKAAAAASEAYHNPVAVVALHIHLVVVEFHSRLAAVMGRHRVPEVAALGLVAGPY